MTESDFQSRLDFMITDYAQENVKAGYWTEEEAQQKSSETFQRLLPDGTATANHYLYTIRDGETKESVGLLWLFAQGSKGFIYDIMIDEDQRRRGYGEAAMLALEAEGQKIGVTQIGLHVFAHNPAALKLYQKIGYQFKSYNMVKDLE
ncbi:MAG: GNAT family N-acetyltransferase [Anaerolineae bacterium]|nr:GNAT family N-acetyltransferase [Anaerolineae bacterium]